MIGYQMGSSSTGVYIMAKISPMENCKHGFKKNNMAANMATFFSSRVLQRSSFLDNLKPLDMKLGFSRPST